MNLYRSADWDVSGEQPAAVVAPYLMGTGVVSGEAAALRPISPPHSHPEAMLAWCYRGTVTVQLQDALWSLAPGQGVWIPAGTPHTARHDRDSTGCYTYVSDAALREPIAEVARVLVPRAVQEMLLHLGVNDMDPGLRVRIQEVLIELLQLPSQEADTRREDRWTELPVPSDERVRALVETVLTEPGAARTARELFAAHGLHERTVLRVFTTEIGMSFRQWRTGVRMSLGARLIAEGTPVGSAALRCGYATTSAFSAAFRERFGVTPREHVSRVRADSARQSYWR
ncbi:AraC family transcriptional regulator [Leucobacter luti]|uniref:AraC family transcriptional regulator n=1 Tax=Leucobacter luti TaxID=340320 RepID=A0A4Q7U427_9MICO|nr:AraC family transcriptional regulator [Leucobacter luti]MBL3700725.1 AraC family transcriptional regulator [Leucobacter luti]RZT68434.1 AraC family transcriptional regulator [Leucobacter luti]